VSELEVEQLVCPRGDELLDSYPCLRVTLML